MRLLFILPVMLGVLLPLAACGKVGRPHQPGPQQDITFPRDYPAPD